MTSTDQGLSFSDRRKAAITEAALAEYQERGEELRRIEDLVLGTNRRGGRRVSELVKLGNDYLVKVEDGDSAQWTPAWTTVVNGEANSWYHERQEKAMLHLIARRYDDNPNSNVNAAHYAGRVLGLPTN